MAKNNFKGRLNREQTPNLDNQNRGSIRSFMIKMDMLRMWTKTTRIQLQIMLYTEIYGCL